MPKAPRFGIDTLTYSRGDGIERHLYFILDLVERHQVEDPEQPGTVLGFTLLDEARVRCADLNRVPHNQTDQLGPREHR